MPKVIVVPPEKVHHGAMPNGFSGDGEALSYITGETFPLELHLHRLSAGNDRSIGPLGADCVAYIWQGSVSAGGRALVAGSSIIIERGGRIAIRADEPVRLLTFHAAQGLAGKSISGHVHLLPAERVPRRADIGSGVGGAMHADSDCPTCDVWLHENHFPGSEPPSEEEQGRGVHSHSEDEIIFVIDGEIRLGKKLFGPGTALAIAADTLYSFTPGPDGLSFINFRAAKPGDIRFASGHAISETAYWRERLPRPEYFQPQEQV